MSADRHGNEIAVEGCTRCDCGCKYWERDLCVDCGAEAVVPCPDCDESPCHPQCLSGGGL